MISFPKHEDNIFSNLTLFVIIILRKKLVFIYSCFQRCHPSYQTRTHISWSKVNFQIIVTRRMAFLVKVLFQSDFPPPSQIKRKPLNNIQLASWWQKLWKTECTVFLSKLCNGKEMNASLYKLLIRFLTFLSYSMQYLISPTSNTPVPSVFVFLYHKHSFSLYSKLWQITLFCHKPFQSRQIKGSYAG